MSDGGVDAPHRSASIVNTTPERREIHFSGRVQGVGFRFTTRAIAARHPVVGFVKNLSDGRVLLVAEGVPEALDRFVDEVRAEMQRYLVDVDVAVGPPRGEFSVFEVRH